MIFSTSPTLYGSAFRPALYTIDELDAPGGVDIEICDLSEAVLGTKRIYAAGSASINAAPYVRAQIAPVPVVSLGHGCHKVYERVGKCIIRVEGEYGPAASLFGGVDDTPVGRLGSAAPSHTSIRPGERDELPIIPTGGTTAPTITFRRGESTFTDTSLGSVQLSTPMTVVVDADTVLAAWTRMTGAPGSELSEFTVTVASGNSRTYTLDHHGSGGQRLAWVNRYGGIDYHTFPTARQVRSAGSRTRIATADGFRTVATSAARSTRLASAPCTSAEAEWLSELFSSPAVWTVRGGGVERVEVSAGEVVATPLQPAVVEVTLESASTPVSRKL